MTLSRRKLREIELDMDDRKFFLGGKTSHEIVLFREVSPDYDKAVDMVVDALKGCHRCWESTEWPHPVDQALAAYEKARGK